MTDKLARADQLAGQACFELAKAAVSLVRAQRSLERMMRIHAELITAERIKQEVEG